MTDKELMAVARRVLLYTSGGEVSDLLERLAAALATHQWRPIETAPREGTKIIVAWGYGTDYSGHIGIMRWSGFGGGGFTEKYMSAPLVRELKNQPTHWMPLPPPPHAEQ